MTYEHIYVCREKVLVVKSPSVITWMRNGQVERFTSWQLFHVYITRSPNQAIFVLSALQEDKGSYVLSYLTGAA